MADSEAIRAEYKDQISIIAMELAQDPCNISRQDIKLAAQRYLELAEEKRDLAAATAAAATAAAAQAAQAASEAAEAEAQAVAEAAVAAGAANHARAAYDAIR